MNEWYNNIGMNEINTENVRKEYKNNKNRKKPTITIESVCFVIKNIIFYKFIAGDFYVFLVLLLLSSYKFIVGNVRQCKITTKSFNFNFELFVCFFFFW